MTVPRSLVYNLEVNTHYGLFIHYMSSSFHNIHYSTGTLHICMHTVSLKSVGSDMVSFSCNLSKVEITIPFFAVNTNIWAF